jgi:hypothetical protein
MTSTQAPLRFAALPNRIASPAGRTYVTPCSVPADDARRRVEAIVLGRWLLRRLLSFDEGALR